MSLNLDGQVFGQEAVEFEWLAEVLNRRVEEFLELFLVAQLLDVEETGSEVLRNVLVAIKDDGAVDEGT